MRKATTYLLIGKIAIPEESPIVNQLVANHELYFQKLDSACAVGPKSHAPWNDPTAIPIIGVGPDTRMRTMRRSIAIRAEPTTIAARQSQCA